jgi:hypothetical protein
MPIGSNPNPDFTDADCTDPETGCYLAFTGEVVTPCPECGHANTLLVKAPTNRFEFKCSACGLGYLACCTLTPMSEPN